MILPSCVRSARDLTCETKILRAGAIRKEENACAVYVLVHRERQPATKDNIIIVKLCGILFIVSRPVVLLFWVRSVDSPDRLLVGESASGGVARPHTLSRGVGCLCQTPSCVQLGAVRQRRLTAQGNEIATLPIRHECLRSLTMTMGAAFSTGHRAGGPTP